MVLTEHVCFCWGVEYLAFTLLDAQLDTALGLILCSRTSGTHTQSTSALEIFVFLHFNQKATPFFELGPSQFKEKSKNPLKWGDGPCENFYKLICAIHT